MRFLTVVLLFLCVSCTPSAEDLVNDLIDDYDDYEEEYECYPGDARLPSGTLPEELITPEGYNWQCDAVDNLQINSNGTFSLTLGSVFYSDWQDYGDECNVRVDRDQTGEWVISLGRICFKYDNLQPGIYACQRFTHSSDAFSLLGNADYYEGSTQIGSEYEPITCTLEEE
jgi:hypothetical protein